MSRDLSRRQRASIRRTCATSSRLAAASTSEGTSQTPFRTRVTHLPRRLWLQVGRSLYLLGRHRAALEVYDELLRLSERDWEVWHNRGLCRVYLKQYDEAIEACCHPRFHQFGPRCLQACRCRRRLLACRSLCALPSLPPPSLTPRPTPSTGSDARKVARAARRDLPAAGCDPRSAGQLSRCRRDVP